MCQVGEEREEEKGRGEAITLFPQIGERGGLEVVFLCLTVFFDLISISCLG
jgi:hypothetical protein